MSSSRQITYGTRSARALLNCTNYLSMHDPSSLVFVLSCATIASVAVFVMFETQTPVPLEMLLLFLVLSLLPAVANSWAALSLIRDPRDCTTSINEDGVTDKTERSKEIFLPWQAVKSIRFNKGSVYFFTWRQSVYVPSYAFASLEDASDFYNQAQKFWHEARDRKISNRITSVDDLLVLEEESKRRIQEFDQEEEAMWKNLEEKHQKQQEN